MSKKCARCDKTVYPTEELKCLDKVWHKICFKCKECGMSLNMRNYKGFNKEPYCEAHIPKAKATTMAETPELRRIAENTKIQSNVKYHADFEKSKGKFTQVADDPETLRIKQNSKIISNVAYHGDLQRKAEMEQKRTINENGYKETVLPADLKNANVVGQSVMGQMQHLHIHGSVPPGNVHGGGQGNVQGNVQGNIQGNMQGNIQGNMQGNIQGNMQGNMQGNVQGNMHGNSQGNMQGNAHGNMQGNLPGNMQQGNEHQRHDLQRNEPQRHEAQRHEPQRHEPQRHEPQRHDPQRHEPQRHEPQRHEAQRHEPQRHEPQRHEPQRHEPQRHEPQRNEPHRYAGNPGGNIGKISDYDPQVGVSPYSARNSQTVIYTSDQGAVNEPQRHIGSVHDIDPVNHNYGSLARVYRAMYDYEAQDDDEVSFKDGDLIVNVSSIDRGWMTGEVQRTGQVGMLPANYVQLANI